MVAFERARIDKREIQKFEKLAIESTQYGGAPAQAFELAELEKKTSIHELDDPEKMIQDFIPVAAEE